MPARPAPQSASNHPSKNDSSTGERLQKVLAAAGIASRRECEELIVEGRVEVDRHVVTELGTRVDPAKQEIRVDGERLHLSRRVYYVVNKPTGVVSTSSDPEGRPRVIDLVPTDERLFPVGRLDKSSEGLMLLTNDGELANQLAHPRYGVEKTYLAHVQGRPTPEKLQQLLDGVHLAEGVARVARLKIKKHTKEYTELELVLKEGRNREIRRVLARIGHKVLRLKRTAIGPIKMGDVAPGAYRRLTLDEIQDLERAGKGSPAGPKRGGAGRKRQAARADSRPEKKGARRSKPASGGSKPDTQPTGRIIGGTAAEPLDAPRPSRKGTAKPAGKRTGHGQATSRGKGAGQGRGLGAGKGPAKGPAKGPGQRKGPAPAKTSKGKPPRKGRR